MKTAIMLLTILMTGSLANAAAEAPKVVVSSREVVVPVEITNKNVKWSRADYMEPVVKVLVPALADVTLLDHRNRGEGAPCLAAYSAKDPEDVVQGREAIENATLRIQLKRIAQLIPAGNGLDMFCQVTLEETIDGKIRGIDFTHIKTAPLGRRHTQDCK